MKRALTGGGGAARIRRSPWERPREGVANAWSTRAGATPRSRLRGVGPALGYDPSSSPPSRAGARAGRVPFRALLRGLAGGATLCCAFASAANEPWPAADFAPGADVATIPIEGRVVIEAKGLSVREHVRAPFIPPIPAELPDLDLELVTSGDLLIPARRDLVITSHPIFDYFVDVGRVWSEDGVGRASLPFALMNRYVNCTHNGVVGFTYAAGNVTDVRVEVTQETCHFAKFDLWGEGRATYTPGPVAHADAIRADVAQERAHRLPTRPIAQLAADRGVDLERLLEGLPRDDDLTTAGAFVDGIHYTADCTTRSGPYPYCEEMLHTSFSTAKTAFPALVLMSLAQRHGVDVYRARIADYVPEVAASKGDWHGVTFDHVGDMTSGNFAIDEPLADPPPGDFYLDLDRRAKLAAALGWPHAAAPGTRFVYQTGDTFILVTALDRWLARHTTMDDAFAYLVDTVLAPLHVPPAVRVSRRTRENGVGNSGTALGGMGMWWTSDALVKVAKLMAIDDGRIDGRQVLHPAPLAAALQRDPADRGLETRFFGTRYNNGTWAAPVRVESVDGPCDVWVPFMTGLSGVRIAMLPNDTLFYYFNDAQAFPTAPSVRALSVVGGLCADAGPRS